MKQLLAISGILLITLGIPSCMNDEWSFPDYDYTTTYFPYQFPIRTLVLGDYNFDNSGDKELRFLISARMGGVYENKENISVQFTVDPTLTDSLYASNVKLQAMPTTLYTLSSPNTILIPAGEFTGGVTVQLDEAFLDDPLAVTLNYVIPLRITSSTTDSILLGNTLNTNPDPRIAGDWITRPRNFTCFGVIFVNEYHGRYLLRGEDQMDSIVNNVHFDTISYRNKYVERCEVATITTAGKNKVTYSNSVRRVPSSPGAFKMDISFDASGNATCIESAGSLFPITGTGKFVKNADEWGGQKRHTIYLDYTIDDGTYLHKVKDTLVFRDKAVTFNEYTPIIKKPAP